jgi:predicted ATPase
VALTRQQAELDPLSEEVHRALLRRLTASGNPGNAIATHTEFRARMLATLRIGPSAETERLVDEIRLGSIAEALPFPAPLRRAQREPFVGREADLQRLRALWTRVLIGSGQAQLALLVGEPGIGKTRLAAKFAREVEEAGGAVLYGACHETALRPYEPFAEALGSSLHGAEAVAEVEERVAAFAATRPVLLVLDDVHWADRSSLALLGRLLCAPFAGRLAVLAAYRETGAADPYLREAVADLRRNCDLERLRLKGLPEGDVRSLLIASAETGAVADRARTIHSRTDGNPFFVRELARHLLEGHGQEIPDAVREVVASRVARLPGPCAEIVSTASVLGDPFPLDLIVALASVEEEVAIDLLDEAAEAGLVEEIEATLYAFVHSLTRDAVYFGLSRTRRARLHRLAADELERRHGLDGGPHLAEIAVHLLQGATGADEARRAVEIASRAAAEAEAQQAYEQAITMYTRALRLVAPGEEALVRRLTVRRAVAFQRLGHAWIDAPTAAS